MADRTKRHPEPTGPARADVIIDGSIRYAGTSDADCVAWLKRHNLAGFVRTWHPWRTSTALLDGAQ